MSLGENEVRVLTPTSRRRSMDEGALIGEFADMSIVHVHSLGIDSLSATIDATRLSVIRAVTDDTVPFETAVQFFRPGVAWKDPIHPMVLFRYEERAMTSRFGDTAIREVEPYRVNLMRSSTGSLIRVTVYEPSAAGNRDPWRAEISYPCELEQQAIDSLSEAWVSSILWMADKC
jgi:hypothetical protein